MTHALIFGASGAIGGAVADTLADAGFTVHGTSREGGGETIALDPIGAPDGLAALDDLPALDAVVWAQGANRNDAAATVEREGFEAVMAANVTYVVVTLARLLQGQRLARPARMVVISSIWQQVARPGKFSYTISKAAIGGLVRAAAVDLAASGHLINAIGPGVTDTPMTRAMLSGEQVDAVAGQTGFGRLTSLGDVAGLIAHLCSAANTGVTGQSIAVDLGFSHARAI
ncbi:MAG: SDR family oxidoreductase [Actinomycetota bacterium]|nr:SDR family oxidoreductase [Actinomycetota bacterium]